MVSCNSLLSQHRCSHQLFNKALSASDSRSDSLNIIHTHLDLDFTDFDSQNLIAQADLLIEAKVDNITHIDLDLEGLLVTQVLLNASELDFEQSADNLNITLDQPYNIGAQFELQISYEGTPITDDTGWGGFYWNANYAYNLGVGFGADPHSFGRAWFPCFDNFLERCTFSYRALTEEPKKAIFNGLPLNSFDGITDSFGITENEWSIESEIPSYLASVAVGDYSLDLSHHLSTPTDSIPMWLIAPQNNLDQVTSSFQNLSPAVSSFEQFYGIYDWSKVGYVFVPFNSGAMEHATNIAYPLSFADGGLDFETLMAHELAHHWWGDYVTCSTAEDMWINEGMASFSEALFTEQVYGEEAYYEWITDNHRNVLLTAHQDDGSYLPVSGVGHENTYGTHVYNKGASVGHNLRSYIGDTNFSLASKEFMNEYALQSVSSEEMRDFYQNYTDRNLTDFFNNWVFNPGFIDFSIENTVVTEVSLDLFEIELTIGQRLHEAPMYFNDVPLIVTLISESNLEEEHSVIITGNQTDVSIMSSFNPKHVILNRKYGLTPAILAEEKTILDIGLDNFSFAEFRSDINDMNASDSLWIRVECHFTGPHEIQPQSEYIISTDRFWRIKGDFPQDIDAGGRLRYYGGESGSYTFDSEFFSLMEDQGLDENEIKLLYRNNSSSLWEEHDNYEVSPQGAEADYIGRIDFLNLKGGDYTWGFETSENSVIELSSSSIFYPNPTANNIYLTGKVNNFHTYSILDSNGRLCANGNISNNTIKCESIIPGNYALQVFNEHGDLVHLEKFIKIKE